MATELIRRRRTQLKKDIAELRELAFGVPEYSPFPEAEYDRIEQESIIRARVLLDCALIEELTALAIMHFVLFDSKKWREIKYFARIKRYHILYADILGRLPARHKMTVVKKFTRVPKNISKTIERMLALRDLFAHIRTLDYRKPELQYRGESILLKAGLQAYMEDSRDVFSFLVKISKVLL
jgi:hypothetical protein